MKRKSSNCLNKIQWVFLVFAVLLTQFFSLAQQNIGQPKITNYDYRDYEASSTNWWVLEGDNGLMYFANTSGVLEFDGVTWNLIPLSNRVSARSLAKDKGIIYVGGESDLGYLAADEMGALKYVSLVDKIPEEHREFFEVWETDLFQGKIIYRTSNKLYIWDGKTMEVIVSKDAFHVGKIMNGRYYVRIWDRGLCVMENGKFNVVPGGERFADERIYVMFPYDEAHILIGTRTQGFFLYDGKTFEPFKTELDEKVRGSLYLPGIALPDGRFVINTFSNGAYLMDHDGKLLQEYTTENGLQDGSADYVYMDSRGLLWIALFNGIARVDINSPFTYINTNMGLENTVVWDVDRLGDNYYFATNNGIFYLKPGSEKLVRVPGTIGQGGDLIKHKGKLYAGTGDMGFFEIKGESFEYVRQSINYDYRARFFVISKIDPNRIFVFYGDGFTSYYYNDQNQKLEYESDLKIALGSSFRERENGDLWMESTKKGEMYVLRPKIEGKTMDLGKSDLTTMKAEDGIPNEYFGFTEFFGDILGYTLAEKEYKYDQNSKKFIEWRPPFADLIDYNNTIFGIRSKYDEKGRLWFSAGSGTAIAEKREDGTYSFNTETFKELRNQAFFQVYLEPTQPDGRITAWFSGADGVVRYNGRLDRPKSLDFETKIRTIAIHGDSLIYAGGENHFPKFELLPDQNSITFNYAAPIYANQKDVQYATWLEGLDTQWSDWTKQVGREYNNLAPGEYTFKVKAKDLSGQVSEETTVPFSIKYPWYSTWWAYLLYAIGFMALVYAIVKWRTRLLRERQKQLEAKVELRTREVQKRMDELATINHVTRALTDKVQLSELIQLVGDEMKKLFNSDITYLALLNADKTIIDFPYQNGDEMPPMKFGEGLTSKVIMTGEALLINKDTDIAAEYDKMGVQKSGKAAISYLGVPIPSEDRIIGVLSVQSTQLESRFNEEDKRLLSTIAINVGVAIHNAELFEEVKTAKARAEDANEAKSAFLSTVSHELRTPLTSVLGFAKIIRKRLEEKIFPVVSKEDSKTERTIKQISENLDVVVSEGERLTTLINDVLDLAKIEAGKMEWNMKPIFLQDALSRAIASTHSLFEIKKLGLKKEIPSNLPLVNADEDKIIQVIINLLSNAVKFTDSGQVTIGTELRDNEVIVKIKDTGIGISEKDSHKVFERFRQAGDTLTDKPKGTGLGLPICREIVEHHGGTIWMESEPDKGSTFFFSLPTFSEGTSRPPVQLKRILTSLKKQIKNSEKNGTEDAPTILVVDDATPIRSLLRQELTEAGYKVQEAADGKAALDMVRNYKPHLIVLDVMMPEINGFDVAAVLKNDPATMDIPIIILSIVQDKERGLRIGVDRYLTKPIDTKQLFLDIDTLLEQGVSKKKVMVVDQDASAVKSLSEVLSARGYNVLESNAENLMESARENQPDIIMLNALNSDDQKLIKEIKLQKGMENVMFFIYE